MPCRSTLPSSVDFFNSRFALLNWLPLLVTNAELLSCPYFRCVKKDMMLKFFAGGLLLLFLYTANPLLFKTLLLVAGGSGSIACDLFCSLALPPPFTKPVATELYAPMLCSFLTLFILTVTMPPLFCDGFTFRFLEMTGGGGCEVVADITTCCWARVDGGSALFKPFGNLRLL